MHLEWRFNYMVYFGKTGLSKKSFKLSLMSIFTGYIDNVQPENKSGRFLLFSPSVLKLSHSIPNVFIALKTVEWNANPFKHLQSSPQPRPVSGYCRRKLRKAEMQIFRHWFHVKWDRRLHQLLL